MAPPAQTHSTSQSNASGLLRAGGVTIKVGEWNLPPGFVQTHIHLCQTLFRGGADDLELIDWLKLRVWPMEAARTPESLYASARLGIAELIKRRNDARIE